MDLKKKKTKEPDEENVKKKETKNVRIVLEKLTKLVDVDRLAAKIIQPLSLL